MTSNALLHHCSRRPRIDGPRGAQVDEAPAISALINAAYRPSSGAAGWTHEAALVGGPRITPKQVLDALSAPDSQVLVALQDDRVVASARVCRFGAVSRIGLLAVDPHLQGSGLGKYMLARAESHAIRRFGARRLSLQVLSARPELIAFYERRGYHRTGEISDYPDDLASGAPLLPGLKIETLEWLA